MISWFEWPLLVTYPMNKKSWDHGIYLQPTLSETSQHLVMVLSSVIKRGWKIPELNEGYLMMVNIMVKTPPNGG